MFWGELIAVGAALGFALASFYLRIGQRDRPHDDGVLTPNAVNLAINLPLAVVLGLLGKLPPLVWLGVGLFMVSGVLTAFLGRMLWARGIRMIGPARATALEGTYPLVTAVLAVLFLGERLTSQGWIGACLAIAGVLLLGWPGPRGKKTLDLPEPISEAPAEPLPPASVRARKDQPVTVLGLLIGLCSSLSFGCGTVVRKVALGLIPSPFIGAPINSATAVTGSLVMILSGPDGRKRVRDSLLRPPPGFIVAGIITTAAQLGNLSAVYLAPVSRVSLINASQPVLAVLLGAIFFRQHDHITWRVVVSALAIVTGVILVTVG